VAPEIKPPKEEEEEEEGKKKPHRNILFSGVTPWVFKKFWFGEYIMGMRILFISL